ncbi:hypothetical protein [Thalassotalea euphylliae]|uniref:Uncharacterized protein n=1 Tax=Thalassotalea euphylliae TaxID=1655234 RepID=A0A3E0U1H4_9GAMM|nr:hypothetical protein [Thalassotalea euphylliae]REL30778.1 hypothetical protein DXX94_08640 [Thalassotalea euphylliae]
MNTQYQPLPRQTKQCSIVLIAAWLFMLCFHSGHMVQSYDEIISQAESLAECHLCHNALDKPVENTIVRQAVQRVYHAKVLAKSLFFPPTQAHFSPPLRAPPAPLLS